MKRAHGRFVPKPRLRAPLPALQYQGPAVEELAAVKGILWQNPGPLTRLAAGVRHRRPRTRAGRPRPGLAGRPGGAGRPARVPPAGLV
jgi:hypothetical protein